MCPESQQDILQGAMVTIGKLFLWIFTFQIERKLNSHIFKSYIGNLL